MQWFNPFGNASGGGGGGEPGKPGKDGRGIVSITFLSSSGGLVPGLPGATDTY